MGGLLLLRGMWGTGGLSPSTPQTPQTPIPRLQDGYDALNATFTEALSQLDLIATEALAMPSAVAAGLAAMSAGWGPALEPLQPSAPLQGPLAACAAEVAAVQRALSDGDVALRSVRDYLRDAGPVGVTDRLPPHPRVADLQARLSATAARLAAAPAGLNATLAAAGGAARALWRARARDLRDGAAPAATEVSQAVARARADVVALHARVREGPPAQADAAAWFGWLVTAARLSPLGLAWLLPGLVGLVWHLVRPSKAPALGMRTSAVLLALLLVPHAALFSAHYTLGFELQRSCHALPRVVEAAPPRDYAAVRLRHPGGALGCGRNGSFAEAVGLRVADAHNGTARVARALAAVARQYADPNVMTAASELRSEVHDLRNASDFDFGRALMEGAPPSPRAAPGDRIAMLFLCTGASVERTSASGHARAGVGGHFVPPFARATPLSQQQRVFPQFMYPRLPFSMVRAEQAL